MADASAEPMAESLQGLRVLVTRPTHQAVNWQRLLEAQGAQTLTAPLLAIEECQGPDARQQIKNRILDLDLYQHAIFVSQNAVAFGCQWIDEYWPQLPMGVAFYAVGKATAQALAQYQIDSVVDTNVDSSCPEHLDAAPMNSEALLTLPQLQQVAGEKILIFRGQGGRPLLAGY